MTSRKPAQDALAPVEFQVFTEIAIIAHLADNAFAKVLPDGVTTAQFGVLNHLTRLGAAQTITEIAQAMQVAQPTMSSTVKKLVEKGLVSLTQSKRDARTRQVVLTDLGREMRKRGVAATAPLQALLAREINAKEWRRLLLPLRRLRCVLDDNR
jgi:DNA-binding MarR family transcriptional regulator